MSFNKKTLTLTTALAFSLIPISSAFAIPNIFPAIQPILL